MNGKRVPSLRATILCRVFPAAIVSLVTLNWIVVQNVNSDICNQIQMQVDNRADGIRLATVTKLRHAIDGCAAIANNDIVVNSVVDVAHRKTNLQPFIQSLDFPGTPAHNIAMLAYDGQVIAQKLSQDNRLDSLKDWLLQSDATEPYLKVTSNELIVAQPVRYASGVEGAFVVIYDAPHFFDDIVQGSDVLSILIYYENDLLASSGNAPVAHGIPRKPKDWFVSRFSVDELPGLFGEIWQSDRTATRTSSAVRNSMFFVLMGISGILLLGMWLPAEFTIKQTKQMLNAIKDVRSNADLSLRVSSGKFSEFQQLQREFNGMLSDLERTTVSREMYRIPAMVARFTDNLVVVTDSSGRIEWVNESFERVSGYTLIELEGKTPGSVLQGPDTDPTTIKRMRDAIENHEGFDVEVKNYSKTGEPYWVSIESRPIRDADGEVVNFIAIESDISERRRVEEEKSRMASEMIELSRHIGKAEVASGVLHNVGNVLNSVNTSASKIGERLESPKRRQLDRVIELLEANRGNLGEYLTHDERGRNVPELLVKLVESLGSDDENLIQETRSLTENIEHITAIISTQQALAGSSGFLEPANINGVVEDALQINATDLRAHSVLVNRDLGEIPNVVLDKQRLLQILVNLIKNAGEAVSEVDSANRQITLHSLATDEAIVVHVIDNGIGIPKERQIEIFSHGFTTKKNGHGFGLHSCAISAREMGGNLSVFSEGEERGATFTLTLPRTPKQTYEYSPKSLAMESKNA